jgi:hypothetical protein
MAIRRTFIVLVCATTVVWMVSIGAKVRYVSDSMTCGLSRGAFLLIQYIGSPEDRKYFIDQYAPAARGLSWGLTEAKRGSRFTDYVVLQGIGRTRTGPYLFDHALITQVGLHVPLWITVVVALAALCVTVIIQRKFRRRTGCCSHCQYDLTGNVSGTCPECGRPVGHQVAGEPGG